MVLGITLPVGTRSKVFLPPTSMPVYALAFHLLEPTHHTSDFTGDVDMIRSTVTGLVEQSQEVIVVTHSYSGIPGGQALEGLDRKSRSEQGLAGGVTRLIYIMSFIVPEGFQHSARGTRDNMVPMMKTNFEVCWPLGS